MNDKVIHDPDVEAHVAKHEPIALEGYMGSVRHPNFYKHVEAFKSRFERKEAAE